MKLTSLNEYGFARGASLDPKRDEQIQISRNKAVPSSSSIPPIAAGAQTRPQTGDAEYDEDLEYDDVTEAMWHLREMTGNIVRIIDVAEFVGMDPQELTDIASDLALRGRLQGEIDNREESIIDHDDLRPLLTHIFGIL